MNLKPCSFRNQQHHATNLPEFHTDLDVGREKRIFKRTCIRAMLAITSSSPLHIFNSRVENFRLDDSANRTKRDERITSSVAFNNAPTRCLAARIDSQNAHGAKVYYSRACTLVLCTLSNKLKTKYQVPKHKS